MRPSEQVLRPAILQPPQAQRCKNISKTFGHSELKSCKIKENIKHKVRNSLWRERRGNTLGDRIKLESVP